MSKDITTTSYWTRNAADHDTWKHIVKIEQGTKTLQTYINGILQEDMRVLNKKYWPYQFRVADKHDTYDIERWCYERLKSANWRNYGRMIAFKRQEDATLYALMWS